MPRTRDILIYEGPHSKHAVVYGGNNENGEHYGYESAGNYFDRDGQRRNGVQRLSGIQFPAEGGSYYYGMGTYREGQTSADARTDPASLKLTHILRLKNAK